jgi:hypothetical protein
MSPAECERQFTDGLSRAVEQERQRSSVGHSLHAPDGVHLPTPAEQGDSAEQV